jgi:hypothetical protein
MKAPETSAVPVSGCSMISATGIRMMMPLMTRDRMSAKAFKPLR